MFTTDADTDVDDTCRRSEQPQQKLHLPKITKRFLRYSHLDIKNNKIAFQWDAYRPLIDYLPAFSASGGVPGLGGVPGPGGCTWSGGVPGLGGVPGPGGCTWSQGVYLVPGGLPGPRGVYLVWGVYLVRGGGVPGPGGCTWSRGVPGPGCVCSRSGGCQVLPPVNRMKDACKNITLPQLRCGR